MADMCWLTMAEVAADFRRCYPRASTARPVSVRECWEFGVSGG